MAKVSHYRSCAREKCLKMKYVQLASWFHEIGKKNEIKMCIANQATAQRLSIQGKMLIGIFRAAHVDAVNEPLAKSVQILNLSRL